MWQNGNIYAYGFQNGPNITVLGFKFDPSPQKVYLMHCMNHHDINGKDQVYHCGLTSDPLHVDDGIISILTKQQMAKLQMIARFWQYGLEQDLCCLRCV